jgi:radical SAM superfamily enzyme YgiQ (UPF0313 family)
LAEIERLPGRHLYFLDDNIFGNPQFSGALFAAMRGMGRIWQAAGTLAGSLNEELLEKAVASGMRSLFIGFETLNETNLKNQHKYQNLNRNYDMAIRRLHDHGVMINASFVFGMDDDDESVFEHTVEWAIRQGIETATFHILTPYPGTALYDRMAEQGMIRSYNWNFYDTRHAVFSPKKMTAGRLESGYWQAYRNFYRWSSIAKSAWTHESITGKLRHLTFTGGWKKCEPLWNLIIRAKRVSSFLPVLETILAGRSKPAVPIREPAEMQHVITSKPARIGTR